MGRALFLSFIFWLVITGIAEGQTVRRTYSNFRKLERYSQRIEEFVRQFNDQRATGLLQQAEAEIEQARTQLFYTDPSGLKLARISMVRAKMYLDQAARIILDKPIVSLKQQLNGLISRAEKAVLQLNNDEANYLLNQAKRFRRRAYDSYKSGNLMKAQQYYRISYFFGRKCIDYTRHKDSDAVDELLDLEISVQQMIDQGEEMLRDDGHPYLASQVAEAKAYYEEAMDMADRGDMESAIKRLRLIKRLLYRMYHQVERADVTGDDQISDELYALRMYLESVSESLYMSGRSQADKLFQQARRLYQEAETAYQNGALMECKQKIAMSQRIANQLFNRLRKNVFQESGNLKIQLEETRRMLRLQESDITNAGTADYRQLWEEALALLDRADSKIEEGQNIIAFQLIQAATRMSVRLKRELRDKSQAGPEEELRQTYKQIKVLVGKITQNKDLDESDQNMLMQILEFTERGGKYLDQENLILAEEYLNTASQQLKQYTARWHRKKTE